MSPAQRLATALVVVVAAATAGCGAGSTAPQPTAGASASSTPTASSRETPMSTPSTPSATAASPGSVSVTVGGTPMSVELYDNAASRDLLTMLPLSATLQDYGGQEKTVALPRALDVTGLPSSAKPAVGELGYYGPNQVLVLYYGDVAAFPGIVRLGRFTQSLDPVRTLPDGTAVTLAAANG